MTFIAPGLSVDWSVVSFYRKHRQSHLPDNRLSEIVERRLAGESWYRLAEELGFKWTSYNDLQLIVYTRLRNDRSRNYLITKLWPKGAPAWVLRKVNRRTVYK